MSDKDDTNSQNERFNVDAWIKLYQSNPQAFEEKRQRWIEDTINAAPKSHQQRLRGLQFQIEGKIKTSKNAHEACVSLSKMMLDSLKTWRGAIHDLQEGKLPKSLEKNKQQSAKILDFSTKTEEEPTN